MDNTIKYDDFKKVDIRLGTIVKADEYRELKNGFSAFKEIHNGTCTAPKIILLIWN